MYTAHFGLSDLPFRLTPDPDYMFMSNGHARAKAYVDYSIASRDGFVVITGDVGAGKTMLMRRLLSEMRESTVLVHIDQTQLTPVEFLQFLVQELVGEVATDNKVELLRLLKQCLEQADTRALRVVVCVDEAQALSFEVLEELRFLSALEARKDALISVVLMGQPELRQMLESPEMEQLRQRVRLHFHLKGLEPDEARTYILHRLRTAGARNASRLFAEDAWEMINKYTGGIPRLINVLCDMALLSAFVNDKHVVDAELIEAAAQERQLTPYNDRQARAEARSTGVVRRQAVPRGGSAKAERNVSPMLERLDGRLQGIEHALTRIADSIDGHQATPALRKRGAS